MEGYILVFEHADCNKAVIDTFLEEIRSNYISKIAYDNMLIVFSAEDAKVMHFKISNAVTSSPNFFITKLDDFYGTLSHETWNWLKERVPGIKTVDNE